jgi:NADH:ubiquinone oxidoreductase subunit C
MNAFELKNIIPVISYDINKNIVVVSNRQLFFSLKCLKLHFNYQYVLLSCISGVDFLGKRYRFGVVYDFLSLNFNKRIRIKNFFK